MVSYYDKLRCAANQGRTPLIAKLEGIFEAIDDGELLKALNGKVHRGCQGYSVEALWHSYLAGYVLNIPTVASLIRRLQSDAALCVVCGLNPAAIPSEATYSRFVAKLTNRRGLVRRAIRIAVRKLGHHLPDLGKIVAIDSSDITAYSQSRRPSDPDAHWAKKKNKHGRDHWWFGYKVHLVVDATHELPLHVEVTSANMSDSQSLIPVLRHAAWTVTPTHVLADAGYDATQNYAFIRNEMNAVPIIKLNKRGAKEDDRPRHRSKGQILAYGLRKFSGIDRLSPQWQSWYDMRVGAERVLSRAKEFRRLASVHHRGLLKVTLHCYLSTLTVVASAVSAIYCQQPLRKVA